jgi:hypothetical protein
LLVASAVALVLSLALSNQLSWLSAVAGLLLAAAWALNHRLYPAVCMVAGGLSNELVRGLNAGHMPVVLAGLPASLRGDLAAMVRDSATYTLVDAHTRLALLADRFQVLPFPGVASVGDLLIAAGIAWLFAAQMLSLRPKKDAAAEQRLAA